MWSCAMLRPRREGSQTKRGRVALFRHGGIYSGFSMRRLFLLVYGVSGAAALIYEVTQTRLLTLQMGHGVAAASTVVAPFMGGLAIGAAVGGRFGGRLTPAGALRAYAIIEIAIAALALL